MMDRVNINVSGACGSGSSINIYETPKYDYWRCGACVMHGSFTVGPASPDSQRIEVVELHMPYFDIRVRADAVRAELRAMLAANVAWETAHVSAHLSAALQPARHQAFTDLQAAVFGAAVQGFTVGHIEKIARAAFAAGQIVGEETTRKRLREVLGL